jgi:hypothetical protein
LRCSSAGYQAEHSVVQAEQVQLATRVFGRAVSSGEVFVLEMAPDGGVEVIDEILIRP